MTKETDNLFEIMHNISNNVLVVVKDIGDLNTKVAVCSKGIEALEHRIEGLETKSRQIVGLLHQKMEPDRCMYMHEQIEKKLKQWTTLYITEGAKGWGRTAMVVLKVLAYVTVTLGSGVWGAKLLGIIRVLP